MGAQQLREYFHGERQSFRVPLADLSATPFQLYVWAALCDIPYGEVRTYGEIAAAVQRPKAARAVGQANHVNPWPIFVPCHRVVAKNGLGGYGGGDKVKRFLLDLESVHYGEKKRLKAS
jgi:O-6-methylguanine DNA methyltransferase